MCLNFTVIYKACPKDPFPLLNINQLVYVISRNGLVSFIDAYSSYNQIKMMRGEEEYIAFIIDCGLYCYVVIPFGLKNARATDVVEAF